MSDWDVVSLAFSGSEPNPDRNDAWPLQTRHACLDLGKSLSLPLVGYVCAYIVRLHIGYVPMQTHVAPRVVVRVCVCACVCVCLCVCVCACACACVCVMYAEVA